MLESLFNKAAGLCGALKAFLKPLESPQKPATLLKRDFNTGVFL